MAKIDISILNLFARYILPFLIGYVILFHVWKPVYKLIKPKLMRSVLKSYWTKIYTCNRKELEQLFAPLHEVARNEGRRKKLRVMEIGIGEGSNFGFYPANCEVFAVDPFSAVEEGLRENIAKHDGLELKSFKSVGAEDMSHIEDNSIDAVVCTLVLCSVKDPKKVVNEVKRILRKGGVFLFWEHVYAVGKFPLSNLQWVVTNIFWFVPFSCDLTQEAWKVIERAGFSKHKYVKHNMAVMALDGIFVFWEHVHASNDKSVARLQCLLSKFWCAVFDGCHLTRKTSEFIQAAQFTTHDFSTITLPVMSVISTTLFGSATK